LNCTIPVKSYQNTQIKTKKRLKNYEKITKNLIMNMQSTAKNKTINNLVYNSLCSRLIIFCCNFKDVCLYFKILPKI